jgi:hypothetical protein
MLLQASSATSKAITASLEAACCCLQVLAAPGLPNNLYMEELVTAMVQLGKYQLQYNVLAFHDAQYKRLYRPASAGTLYSMPVCRMLQNCVAQKYAWCPLACRKLRRGPY